MHVKYKILLHASLDKNEFIDYGNDGKIPFFKLSLQKLTLEFHFFSGHNFQVIKGINLKLHTQTENISERGTVHKYCTSATLISLLNIAL